MLSRLSVWETLRGMFFEQYSRASSKHVAWDLTQPHKRFQDHGQQHVCHSAPRTRSLQRDQTLKAVKWIKFVWDCIVTFYLICFFLRPTYNIYLSFILKWIFNAILYCSIVFYNTFLLGCDFIIFLLWLMCYVILLFTALIYIMLEKLQYILHVYSLIE